MIWLKGELRKMYQVKEWFDLSKRKKIVRGRFKFVLIEIIINEISECMIIEWNKTEKKNTCK